MHGTPLPYPSPYLYPYPCPFPYLHTRTRSAASVDWFAGEAVRVAGDVLEPPSRWWAGEGYVPKISIIIKKPTQSRESKTSTPVVPAGGRACGWGL